MISITAETRIYGLPMQCNTVKLSKIRHILKHAG